jgi:hypothetical protein
VFHLIATIDLSSSFMSNDFGLGCPEVLIDVFRPKLLQSLFEHLLDCFKSRRLNQLGNGVRIIGSLTEVRTVPNNEKSGSLKDNP